MTPSEIQATCRAPGGCIIDDQGVVRKVLGTLPITADGYVVGVNAVIYFRDGSHPNRIVLNFWRPDVTRPSPLLCGMAYSKPEAVEETPDTGIVECAVCRKIGKNFALGCDGLPRCSNCGGDGT